MWYIHNYQPATPTVLLYRSPEMKAGGQHPSSKTVLDVHLHYEVVFDFPFMGLSLLMIMVYNS